MFLNVTNQRECSLARRESFESIPPSRHTANFCHHSRHPPSHPCPQTSPPAPYRRRNPCNSAKPTIIISGQTQENAL